MQRRVHIQSFRKGDIELDPRQAHHLRNVLRAQIGQEVEVFDSQGNYAMGIILTCDQQRLILRVDEPATPIHPLEKSGLIIASAIPKSDRADWMIEKLTELGVTRFIPLLTHRSVVHPKGKNKLDRWQRLATEAAKQSRQNGVMQIDNPTELIDFLNNLGPLADMVHLSTDPAADSILDHACNRSARRPLCALIGPEGGWSEDETSRFVTSGIIALRLTATILRIETAAIAAASILSVAQAVSQPQPSE